MKFLDQIYSQTGMFNYTPDDSKVIVAGKELMDYTTVTVNPNQKRRSEQGVHQHYHTYVDLPTFTQITISFLAACADIKFMDELQDFQDANGGAFNVVVNNGGRYAGTYKCYFLSDPAESINEDAEDRVYELAGVKVNEKFVF